MSELANLPRQPEANPIQPGDQVAYDAYRGNLRLALSLTLPAQVFGATVTSADGSPQGAVDEALLEAQATAQRVLLKGAGGAGKTTALKALGVSLIDAGVVVVFLDLREQREALFPDKSALELEDLVVSPAMVITPSLTRLAKIALHQGRRTVWLVDGMNQLPPRTAYLVRRALRGLDPAPEAIVITDRQAEAYTEGWAILDLVDLSDSQVESFVDGRFGTGAYAALTAKQKGILRRSFFLNLAIESPVPPSAASECEAIRMYLDQVVGLLPADIATAGRLALDLYTGADVEPPGELWQRVSAHARGSLSETGTVVAAGSTVTFRHPLLLDYFAATYLAQNPTLWNVIVFDAVSLDANALDCVLFVAQMLDERALADHFLTQLHDWNWHATTRALAELGQGATALSDGIVLALWAMVAAKQFDRVNESAERAKQRTAALDDVFSDDYSLRFGDADTVDDVDAMLGVATASIPPQGSWFAPWLTTFNGSLSTAQLTERLHNTNPLIGWAAANGIRRRPLTKEPEVRDSLRTIYEAALIDEGPTAPSVRWRVVHAIAESEAVEDETLLLEALDQDPYSWVQYGAVRGLVEMAARRSGPGRDRVLAALMRRVGGLADEPATQLFWASTYREPMPGWRKAVRPLLVAAVEASPNERQRERREARLRKLELNLRD